MVEHITFLICGILALGILCQWFAWWVKLPAILFLLLTGLLVGPGLHLLDPDKLFGDLFFPVISIAVAIILFEGSLSLKFSEIGSMGRMIRNLVTIGYAITTLATMLFAHFFFKFPWQLSLLFGAITSIGGPTVVAPILRSIRLKEELNKILHWESILIDPIGALITVLIFGLVSTTIGNHSAMTEVTNFVAVILVGSAIGISFGYALGQCIQRLIIPEYLTNVITLTTVVLAYTLTDWIDSGGGLLAASLMGITMANMRNLHIKDIIHFKESLSILMISSLFIVLAARIQFTSNFHLVAIAGLLFVVLQFLVRPIAVWICARGNQLKWREKIMLSWICPRGIITAAVAAVFSYRLIENGYQAAQPFVILSFSLILMTVIFESLTARLAAKVLGQYIPEPTGILIVGANPFSIALAKALSEHNIKVLMMSKEWHCLVKARHAGIETIYGDALSKETTDRLDLTPYGYLLATTGHHEYNVLVCLHYKDNFESRHVSTLIADSENSDKAIKPQSTSEKGYRRLFAPAQTYGQLEERMLAHELIQFYVYPESNEAVDDKDIHPQNIHTTETGDKHHEKDHTVRLIAINPAGIPYPYSTHDEPPCAPGWTLLYLAPTRQE